MEDYKRLNLHINMLKKSIVDSIEKAVSHIFHILRLLQRYLGKRALG